MDILLPPGLFHYMPLWLIFFFVIYFHNWQHASWKKRRNIAIAVVLIPMTFLIPLHIWGTYNLIGIENNGVFAGPFTTLETSSNISPNTTYTSEILSNLYTMELVKVSISTSDSVVFYILDENKPDVRYAEVNITDTEYQISIYLPYYYTELFIVAKWTLNIHNPSSNTTVDYTITMHGLYGWPAAHEQPRYRWSYQQFIQPFWALLSLCIAYVSSTFIAFYYYDELEP